DATKKSIHRLRPCTHRRQDCSGPDRPAAGFKFPQEAVSNPIGDKLSTATGGGSRAVRFCMAQFLGVAIEKLDKHTEVFDGFSFFGRSFGAGSRSPAAFGQAALAGGGAQFGGRRGSEWPA